MIKSTPIETRRGFVETAGPPAAGSLSGTTATAGARIPSGATS